jgi:DNA-directed RNA polymerase specialized sigma24 family protein
MVDSDLERQLVAKATAGDRVALHQLLLMYARLLAQHIAPKIPRSVQGVISAEDITQQTFSYVFRHMHESVPQSDGAFCVWLKQIAECRTQDAVKTLKRDKRGGNRRQVRRLAGESASSMADLVDMLSAGSLRRADRPPGTKRSLPFSKQSTTSPTTTARQSSCAC